MNPGTKTASVSTNPLRRLSTRVKESQPELSQHVRNGCKEQRIAQAANGFPERKETDERDDDDEQTIGLRPADAGLLSPQCVVAGRRHGAVVSSADSWMPFLRISQA